MWYAEARSEPYSYFVERREFGDQKLMIPKVYVDNLRRSLPEGSHLLVDTTRECLADDQYDSYLISREAAAEELCLDALIFQHLVRINGALRAIKERLCL